MPQPLDTTTVPDRSAIAALHAELQSWIRTTPVLEKVDFEPIPGTAVNFKFELLQASGTFKARGAFSNLLALDRSEEHTSELQSLMRISYAVFCLKKKNNNRQTK